MDIYVYVTAIITGLLMVGFQHATEWYNVVLFKILPVTTAGVSALLLFQKLGWI